MNEKQAIAAMQKLWGKKFAYRYNKKALVGEEREQLRTQLASLYAVEKEATNARDARREELLKDPEYIRLKDAASQALKERQEASGKIYTRRVTIGRMSGSFFIIEAEGDNWAEAIKKAKGGENE